ncbi:MAG: N-acetylmuramoyl-L-alanine amidase [Fidelibacterota bacterium]|nr:MAG: N-acetylmuramoyl-L-alanine amidase [Candidatus Neomarinimicrobiota bacterium]
MDIVNVVKKLPWHEARRWRTRDLSAIDKIIVHQELSDGTVEAVNNYHITPGNNNHVSKKGAPHFCYHFGIRMARPEGPPDGEIIQANELTHITWHTGGQNRVGVGIMLEGNFKGMGHDLGHEKPSKAQIDSLNWLAGHLIDLLDLTNQDLYGHYHFGKPACPGSYVTGWIEEYRGRTLPGANTKIAVISIKDLQKQLKRLGYAVGKVDGIIGPRTTGAIWAFQRDQGLSIDGIPGPQTRRRLLALTTEEENG